MPLSGASPTFAPLPKDALLGNGRYRVVEVRHSDERQNLYLVEDSWVVRVCPRCREKNADPTVRFCPFCGTDLVTVTPLSLRLLARENVAEEAFAAETRLLQANLEHPALLLPHDAFVEAPYGPPRAYLVEPTSPPARATSLTVPQGVEQVLEWGESLARGLAHLHQNYATFRRVTLDDISVEGRRARWICTDKVQFSSPEQPDTRQQAANVADLSRLLFYLITGQTGKPSEATLPPVLADLFARALGEPPTLTDAAALAEGLQEALRTIRQPPGLALSVGWRTDLGQQRSVNEDSLLVLNLAVAFHSLSLPLGLFAVADGMGGHEAGDVASQCAVDAVARLLVDDLLAATLAGKPIPDAGPRLLAAVQAASQAVYERRRGIGSDMGTTLVVLLICGERATIANVGDSRAYLLTPQAITRVTTDHSLVERMVAIGQITREEAANHPQRSVIYRTVGNEPKVDADLYQVTLSPGQAVLLCSDGLSGMVGDETLWELWRTSASPQEACDRMVEAANSAGGNDNISVVIVHMVAHDRR